MMSRNIAVLAGDVVPYIVCQVTSPSPSLAQHALDGADNSVYLEITAER